MTTKVILDCDPGHDDAVAILLACASPELDVLAITTVAGNQTVDRTSLNARRVCGLAGITGIPIAAGSPSPLRRPLLIAPDFHGQSGLDGPAWGPPTVPLDSRGAVDLIIELVRAHNGVTIVATGPLTNVASAIILDPGIVSRIGRISMMGGAIGLGNRTPAAEFNMLADPEAAAIVFGSGIPITMIGLEVTHQALATDRVVGRIDAIGTPVARMVVELITFFGGRYKELRGFDAPAIHDPCAVAWVIDPGLVTTVPAHVEVETRSQFCDGRTVCDVSGVLGLPPNALVGTGLDANRFWELVVGAISTFRSPLPSDGPIPAGKVG